MSQCKIIEKCHKCNCNATSQSGLSAQIQVPRPTERVIERQIVELATRCEACCDCNQEESNAN